MSGQVAVRAHILMCFKKAGSVIMEDDDGGEWSGSRQAGRQADERGPAMLDQELVLVLDNS